jgi:hypothetical protein
MIAELKQARRPSLPSDSRSGGSGPVGGDLQNRFEPVLFGNRFDSRMIPETSGAYHPPVSRLAFAPSKLETVDDQGNETLNQDAKRSRLASQSNYGATSRKATAFVN